jgi:histidine triad (HIT) family protein
MSNDNETACVFCEIANGSVEAEIVYRDASVTAFLDWNPINPGHMLVVPNIHVPNFEDLDAATLVALMSVVQRLSKVSRNVYLPKKVGLAVAGFDVPHTHVHVVPMHDYHDITSKKLLDGLLYRSTPDELEVEGMRIREGVERDRCCEL